MVHPCEIQKVKVLYLTTEQTSLKVPKQNVGYVCIVGLYFLLTRCCAEITQLSKNCVSTVTKFLSSTEDSSSPNFTKRNGSTSSSTPDARHASNKRRAGSSINTPKIQQPRKHVKKKLLVSIVEKAKQMYGRQATTPCGFPAYTSLFPLVFARNHARDVRSEMRICWGRQGAAQDAYLAIGFSTWIVLLACVFLSTRVQWTSGAGKATWIRGVYVLSTVAVLLYNFLPI